MRLLLLGKGAVLAHRFERPDAAEMDEEQARTLGVLLIDEAVAQTPRGPLDRF